jgi:TonB-linked SusC/RagA family outer membrane protein
MPVKRLLRNVGLSLLLLIFTQSLFAQERTVTGKVTDKNGAPLAGISVTVKGTGRGVATDANGNYRITVPASATTLVISSVGYGTQDVSISSSNTGDVSLTETGTNLNEIVVVGYGTAKRKDLTGSVASVQSKDFNKGTYTSPDQLIQGKVAGLQIVNNSGQPGGAATIKIRGNASVTGSGQPLFIIDGVELDGRTARPNQNASGLGDEPGGNPLNFINPADIASIDILKDASATAIYGSRAAFGVIIITTKKGTSGQPKIDFGTSVGFASILKKIKVLDAAQYRAALTYYGVSAANDKGSSVDALGSVLQKATVQNYNISISGGNDVGRYRFSASMLDQQGIVRKTGIKKYTASLTTNFKFLESKKLGLDINVLPSFYVDQTAPISNNAGSTGSLIGQALQWNPTEPLKNANGSFNIKAGDIINPLAMSEAYDDHSKVTTILGSISPYYKLTSWLEYRMLFSVTHSSGIRRSSIQSYINLGDVKDFGWASISTNELSTEQVTHTLNFNKALTSKLTLSGVVGYEYIKFTNQGTNLNAFGPSISGGFGAFGLDYTNYIQFSNPSKRNVSSFIDPTTELQSYFARAVFNYNDRYLLTGTIRGDGSSKFGKNNRYGYFPSFAGAWNITRESFFHVDAINSLKLRAGWGKTGNQEFPAGSAQAKYSFSNNGGLGQTNYDNASLQWQSDRQYNIGLDAIVLKNKLSVTVDYFNKRTTHLLFPLIPDANGPSGSSVIWENLPGSVTNKGVEVALNATLIDKADLSVDLGVNATFLKNDVEDIPAPILTGGLHGQGITGTFVQTIRNGLPINTFYTRQFLGLDKTSGLALYTDDGATFYSVGNPNPTTLLGITASVRYKKLTLTANMNGAFGQMIYNNTLNNVINVGSINGGRNIAVSVYQSPVKESFANPVTASSRFIEKGDYMKLTNAILAYSIGNVAKIFRGATVYVSAQNLFILTKFSGFDPEVNVDKNNRGVPSVGIEYTPYPTARTITFGVNFSL